MIFRWFQIFNKQEFLASGLPSWNLQYSMEQWGVKDILVSQGNLVSVLIDGVYLPLELLEQNPYYKDGYGVFIDENDNVILGFAIDNVTPIDPPEVVPPAPTEVVWLRGPQGEPGARGLPGPAGPAGADGIPGLQGPKGDKGDTGDQGPQGEKGDTGDTGATGPTGPTGPQGDDAVAGSLNLLVDPLFIEEDLTQFNLNVGTLSFVDGTAGGITSPTVQKSLKVAAGSDSTLLITINPTSEYNGYDGLIHFLIKSSADLSLEIYDGSTVLSTTPIPSTGGKWKFITVSNFKLKTGPFYARINKVGASTDFYLASMYFGPLIAELGSVFIPSPARAGFVSIFAGTVAPAGWMLCDGSNLLRASYPQLFAAIGTKHGSGGSLDHFAIPDYRGRFLRGVDGSANRDPDKNTRQEMSSGGATGNDVGSVQTAQIQGHTHSVTGTAASAGAHTHSVYASSIYEVGTLSNGGVNYGYTAPPVTSGSSGAHTHTISGTAASGGGSETRPLNAYVNFIIKLYDDPDYIPVQSGNSGGGVLDEENYMAEYQFADYIGPVSSPIESPRTNAKEWRHSADTSITQDTTGLVRGENSVKFAATDAQPSYFQTPMFTIAPADLEKDIGIYFEYKGDFPLEVKVLRYDGSGTYQSVQTLIPISDSLTLDDSGAVKEFQATFQPSGTQSDQYVVQWDYTSSAGTETAYLSNFKFKAYSENVSSGAAGEFNYLGKWETADFLGVIDTSLPNPRNSKNWGHGLYGAITKDKTSKIRGESSFKFSGTAVSSSHHAFESPMFTLAPNDINVPLKVFFEYIGNWNLGTRVRRYDSSGSFQEEVTLQVSSIFLDDTETSRIFEGWFQPSGNPTDQYSIQWSGSGTDTNYAYLDSFIVQRFQKTIGPSMQDWTDYSVVISAGTGTPNIGSTGTISSKYKVVGSTLYIAINANFSGASVSVGTSELRFSMPPGFTTKETGTYITSFPTGAVTRGNPGGSTTDARVVQGYVRNRAFLCMGISQIDNVSPGSRWIPNGFGIEDSQYSISMEWQVEVNETSANTVMYNRALTEWVSKDGSDVFGPQGALVPNIAFGTGTTAIDVVPPGGNSATALYIPELSNSNGWTTVLPQFWQGNNANTNNYYGISGGWLNSTTYRFTFGNRGIRVSASNADNGNEAWATARAAGLRFRLRNISDGGAAAGPIEITNFTNPNGTLFSNSDGDINGQRDLSIIRNAVIGGNLSLTGLLLGIFSGRTTGGSGTGAISLGVNPYNSNAGGAAIVLCASNTSSGSNTTSSLFFIRKYQSNATVWASSAATVNEVVKLGTGVSYTFSLVSGSIAVTASTGGNHKYFVIEL